MSRKGRLIGTAIGRSVQRARLTQSDTLTVDLNVTLRRHSWGPLARRTAGFYLFELIVYIKGRGFCWRGGTDQYWVSTAEARRHDGAASCRPRSAAAPSLATGCSADPAPHHVWRCTAVLHPGKGDVSTATRGCKAPSDSSGERRRAGGAAGGSVHRPRWEVTRGRSRRQVRRRRTGGRRRSGG